MTIWSRLRLLWRSKTSTAAVEFALVAPVLLIMFVGAAEMLLLYRTEAKLTELSTNVAQMVSLQDVATGVTTGTNGILGQICKIGTYGLQPFPAKGLTVAIASITEATAATTAPVVAATYDYWEADNSCANAATAIGPIAACNLALRGAAGTLLINKDDNIIIVRSTLTYPGIVGLILGSAPTLSQTSYARWRYASSLATPSELKCNTTNAACNLASYIGIPC